MTQKARLAGYVSIIAACALAFGTSASFVATETIRLVGANMKPAVGTTEPVPFQRRVPDTPSVPLNAIPVAMASKPATAAIFVEPAPEAMPIAVEALPVPSAATHMANIEVNVRASPQNGSARVGVLRRGQPVTIVTEEGGWMQVATGAVVIGWVYGRYLTRDTLLR